MTTLSDSTSSTDEKTQRECEKNVVEGGIENTIQMQTVVSSGYGQAEIFFYSALGISFIGWGIAVLSEWVGNMFFLYTFIILTTIGSAGVLFHFVFAFK